MPSVDPYFLTCVREAANTPELVAEFDRLTGNNLSRRGSGLDLLIDDSTGRTETGFHEFLEFVYETIYARTKEVDGG